jgi:hypothetical protein
LNATKNSEEKRDRWLEPTIFVICAVIVGTLVLGLAFDALYTMYRESLIGVLNRATGLTKFFANVAVLFYAFPAFARTKDRCFLSIALAALMLAYDTLFGLILSVQPLGTRHISHVQQTWYYATTYVTTIIGLILYAYGVIALIRRGHPNDLTKR